jgi:hypothetical protein
MDAIVVLKAAQTMQCYYSTRTQDCYYCYSVHTQLVRGRESGCYFHPSFQRGEYELLRQVKRGVVPACPPYYERKIYGCGARPGGSEDSSDSEPEMTPLPRNSSQNSERQRSAAALQAAAARKKAAAAAAAEETEESVVAAGRVPLPAAAVGKSSAGGLQIGVNVEVCSKSITC